MWFRNQHVNIYLSWFGGFPGGAVVKIFLPMQETQETRVWSRVGKIPWRKWQPTPVFLPGKFHGPRSLGGYSPQGHKESDMTDYDAVTPLNAHCKTLDRTLLFLKGHLLSQFFGILPDLDLNVIIAREFQHFPCCWSHSHATFCWELHIEIVL